MTDIIDINDAEQAPASDYTNIGVLARKAVQDVVGAAVGYAHHWSGFALSTKSATELQVDAGAFLVDDTVYTLDPEDAPLVVDLSVHLPVTTGDQKYVAILVRGSTSVVNDNVLIEVDSETHELVQQNLPKRNRLVVSFEVQDGLPSPTPLKPVVAGTDCGLCFVLLSTTGIVSFEADANCRATTLSELNDAVVLLQGDMGDIRQRVATTETEIAVIFGRLHDIPRPELMDQIKRDVASHSRILNTPSNARGYIYDPCLVLDIWDTQHADWLGRIREGGRAQFASIRDNQLSTLTAGDPLLKITNNLALPQWTEVTRINVEGDDGTKDISDQVHTVTTAVQNTVSGVSISYGPTVTVCENNSQWASVATVDPGQTFNVNGQTYISNGLSQSTVAQPGFNDSPAQWNADPQSVGHKNFDVQQVSYDSWSETYWTYQTKSYGVNGSIYGETFLNSQQCVATSINLTFKRVDTSADVHLYVCECDTSGAPQFESVIATSTVAGANLVLGKVKFPFDQPALLDPGKRYAWFTVTDGNNALATVSNNKFAQGSSFWATDGDWAQGDNTIDFAFDLNVAQFAATRTQVYFQSLTCDGGMTEIQLLYRGWTPPGTSLYWEIGVDNGGATEWISILSPFDPIAESPLVGLPPTAQLRATFVGTTDLMPAIILDNSARGAAMRMRSDMTLVSKDHDFGFSTTAITLITTLDNFDVAHNTFTPAIMVGATLYNTPDTTTITVDPNKALRRKIVATFTVPATTSARMHPSMDTDNVVDQAFVQDIEMTGA